MVNKPIRIDRKFELVGECGRCRDKLSKGIDIVRNITLI